MASIGKITKIKMQKNNKERCSIFVDGEYLVGINAELIYKFNLEKGHQLTEEVLEYILEQEDFSQAKKAAFNLLSYRQRSYQEMRDRLTEKGFDSFIINQVIRILERLEYINDREFATAWINDRISRGFGPYRIRMQLKKKGVSSKIIEEELNNEYDFDLEYKLAYKLADKKRGRYKGLEQREAQYKLSQVLKRKGFSFDVINLVMEDLELE